MIESKVSVDLSRLTDYQVYTDSKWLDFILGQLIENAVKYRSNQSRLTWCSWEEENKVILELQDNGIGIPAQDVPRVFEKGILLAKMVAVMVNQLVLVSTYAISYVKNWDWLFRLFQKRARERAYDWCFLVDSPFKHRLTKV